MKSVIPADTYPGNSKETSSLGIVATLLSSTETSIDIIYEVTKAFFSNLDNFRAASPVFSSLTDEQMIEAGFTVPVHAGALKYFIDSGLK